MAQFLVLFRCLTFTTAAYSVVCSHFATGDQMVDRHLKIGPLELESAESFHGKLRGIAPGQGKELARGQEIAVVIKVRPSGYVPESVTVVSRITPFLFTARLKDEGDLERVAADPRIERIELSDDAAAMRRGKD
jgi:hypothetical protein